MMGESEECVFWIDKESVHHEHCFDAATKSFINDQELSSKRVRLSPNRDDQEGDADSGEQESPLGLTLRKSSSLQKLLQACLCNGKFEDAPAPDNRSHQLDKPRTKRDDDGPLSMSEKLKASNFPATFIRIGAWQWATKHEGDLTAKLYYAKQKLVWEVLDGTLKSKIEIQWSNIIAIRAMTRDCEPGSLEIELNQPPLFYREIDPQPRKHTLWQQTSDFTGGQAPIWRRHYVVFPPGILDRHYEKLLLCDQRLFDLSQQPFPINRSPYFDPTMFGLPQHTLSFNGYGSSANYLPGMQQYPHQTCTTAPRRAPTRLVPYSTLPVTELPFRHEGRSNNNHFVTPTQIAWENIVNSNNQYPFNIGSAVTSNRMHPSQNYQPNSGLLYDIENHLLGESHQVGPESMCPLLEPPDVNLNYYANWTGTNNVNNSVAGADQVIQYGRCTNPISDGVFSEPSNWMTFPQSNDTAVMSYTPIYSMPPFQYPDNSNNEDSIFNLK